MSILLDHITTLVVQRRFDLDERSSADDGRPNSPLTLNFERRMGDQRHDDEDVRPTSQKELAGWYSYGWAAEVFAICAMGSFLPMTLEQLARDRGVLLSDKTTPCRAASDSSHTTTISTSTKHELPACIVQVGGLEINTASFAMYTFSLSVLVQSLLIVSMSGAADHGRVRKTLLLALAFTGATATMSFILVVPRVYLLGALLAIISNTCFGASFVLLNSFLPVLVRHHPTISHRYDRLDHDGSAREYNSDDPGEFPTAASSLLTPSSAANSAELKLATKISSNGIGIGYVAGLLVQIGSIFVVSATGSDTFSLRLVLFVVGLWWLAFTIPAALWLRPRPGPPLPARLGGGCGYVTYAWTTLFQTVSHAKQLKDIMIFLAAWFMLSDAIATVSGTAVLFAKTNLGMKVEALALISVVGTISGTIGAFYWSSFSRYFNLRASQTIVACVCLFEVIPLYGLLGFIPAIQRLGYFGLQQPIEMYFLGALYGFVLGGVSSYCRAFFGDLIPPGFEASFYALYAITDKGSSVFGPAIVGAITDRYGDIRPAFVFLAVLIFLPLPLLLLVDVDRGKADAAAIALELQGKHDEGTPNQRLADESQINYVD